MRPSAGATHGKAHGAVVSMATICQSWLIHRSGARSAKVAVNVMRPSSTRTPESRTLNVGGCGGTTGAIAPPGA